MHGIAWDATLLGRPVRRGSMGWLAFPKFPARSRRCLYSQVGVSIWPTSQSARSQSPGLFPGPSIFPDSRPFWPVLYPIRGLQGHLSPEETGLPKTHDLPLAQRVSGILDRCSPALNPWYMGISTEETLQTDLIDLVSPGR
jgi:hypothetical protein